MNDDIISAVKGFILEKFLPGEDPSQLTPDTPLMTSGILDSLATLELVSFLEDRYGIELAPADVDATRLGTLSQIAKLVSAKSARGA
jgi:acyl carrier protein